MDDETGIGIVKSPGSGNAPLGPADGDLIGVWRRHRRSGLGRDGRRRSGLRHRDIQYEKVYPGQGEPQTGLQFQAACAFLPKQYRLVVQALKEPDAVRICERGLVIADTFALDDYLVVLGAAYGGADAGHRKGLLLGRVWEYD